MVQEEWKCTTLAARYFFCKYFKLLHKIALIFEQEQMITILQFHYVIAVFSQHELQSPPQSITNKSGHIGGRVERRRRKENEMKQEAGYPYFREFTTLSNIRIHLN